MTMQWNKLLSGQWILTCICGGVFAYVACTKVIPPDATIAILTTVFISYFKRDRPEPPTEGGK